MNTNEIGRNVERIAIDILEAEGYIVHRCIRSGQKRGAFYVSHSNDIFGCVDLLAKKRGERMRFIQVTKERAIGEKIADLSAVPWDKALESVEIWRWVDGTGKRILKNGKIRDRLYFQVYHLDDDFQRDKERRIRPPTATTALAPAAPAIPPVSAPGATLECTIVVKAAPERSAKYGETVCTAAVLDDGRLIRLYPVKIDEYWKKDIKKYTRVKVDVIPSDERAGRPESHKLQAGLDPLPSPLVGSPTPWPERMALVAKAVRPNGMRGLRDLQKQHGTSLGIVKVRQLIDFRITASLDDVIEQADYRQSKQQTLTGEAIMEGSRVDKIKHVFRYKWRCTGSCCDDDAEGQGFHYTTCEDWELFQAFREWRKTYGDRVVWALKNRFFDCMAQSTDLHFAMGTPSDPKMQDSWMIVGLIYPNIPGREPDPRKPSLANGILDESKVVQPDSKLDKVANVDGKTKTTATAVVKPKPGQQQLALVPAC